MAGPGGGGEGLKGLFLPLLHILSAEQCNILAAGLLLRMRGRGGVEEREGGGCRSNSWARQGVCVSGPGPQTPGVRRL